MKISDIRKSFDDFSLYVKELDIPQGKIYGIIGPNGCGKTTLMKIAAGLIKPDSGHVNHGNLTISDITMVFRKPYLLHDSVIRNLTYPLKIRKIKPDRAMLEHYLELAGLKDSRDKYAPGLSGGQQQKLGLIRAMIFSPKLVFLDEAFSNLDMESADVFEQFIIEHHQQKPSTFVVCAHQLSHIRRLCEYVYFMYEGRIETHGSTDEILLQPQNGRLQSYLKYASFN